jgi:hypothetical protein
VRPQVETKAAVTVAEMARMVGLSRARFYQLVAEDVFPPPVYEVRTRRPLYTEDLQRTCLEVRRRNRGVNGRPVLFYARRVPSTALTPTLRRSKPITPRTAEDHADLLDGLKSLGLGSATAADVRAAVRSVYPGGVGGVDPGEVLRAVFLHLRRQNPADSVGR